ncbi:hypothetical protein SAMN05443144_10768 [Fodinibius roseus]|uniref:Uncharacterized protein n=1 Tax=Fodinibius roseus TaxID=1194090 RepID=A0A1M5AH56_9BACT|nr:hypothetical protein [Fodinibius roseus]SHF29640.1 hypothetical protein SAMN05443144_10768 [Fodinibius roseus]
MLQNEQPIELNIVPDKSMVMGKKETEQLDDGGLYWEGTLQNRIGEVRLVADNEGVVGYLKAPSDSLFYKFQPIGDGLHAVIQVDPSKAIPDHSSDNPSGPPDYGDCSREAIYYVTAQNRTGESSYFHTERVCIE